MTLHIYQNTGGHDMWHESEYTDYKQVEGKKDDYFVVIRDGAWVASYPMSNVTKWIAK